MSKKVGLIGCGAVGGSFAYCLALLGISDELVMYDLLYKQTKGKAIDLMQSAVYTPKPININAVEKIEEMTNCDVVVITAGMARKQGMTRDDLLLINAEIIQDVVKNISKSSPNAIIINVSNPLDVMTYLTYNKSGFAKNQIIGMGGALDNARMAYQLSKSSNISMEKIRGFVIGDHGENMLPLTHFASINNIGADNFIGKKNRDEISKNTRFGGKEIVDLLGTSAYYAPGRAIAYLVDSILGDKKKLVSCSVLLEGEYGFDNLCMGVPIVVGKNGVEKIVKLNLNKEELNNLEKSANSIKEGIKILKDNNVI